MDLFHLLASTPSDSVFKGKDRPLGGLSPNEKFGRNPFKKNSEKSRKSRAEKEEWDMFRL